ncbi:hypothetical protein GW17_00000632 [Ensete ventricosum]|nr:hypothetical protein GW17_00000632 [Ensete ventricosum]
MPLSLHRAAGWPPAAPLRCPPLRRRSYAAYPRPPGAPAAAARVEDASSSSSFDPAAFEAERLRLDAEARASMAAAAAASDAEGEGKGGDPKAWKWKIRKRVWDLLEAEDIARNPRPVHHRIPNFAGAALAADSVWFKYVGIKLGKLDVFQKAQCVKVNPDSPQKQVRFFTLTGWSTVPSPNKLLTPQPRLRTGFFSVLQSQTLPSGSILEACTSVGAAKYGRPIGLDEKIKVDLIVIGSVAVDPRTGARLGKGEVSFHDKQLVDDIPVEKLLVHDVPVDIICTPTQIIYTDTRIPKPQGIYWEKLSPEKLGQIRILRELKRRIEQETGQLLPTGPPEKLPPTARRRR